MLKKILTVFVVLVAAFAGYVAVLPSHYSLSRSTLISASPDVVFDNVNDFHKWEAWSPWAKLDPNAKISFVGPPTGKGSVFRWAGNSNIGEGAMTIVDSRPSEAVGIKLAFVKPLEGESDIAITLKPESGATRVNWTLSGEHGFLERAMCTLMGGMERMVGPEYEKALANLKAVAEGKKG